MTKIYSVSGAALVNRLTVTSEQCNFSSSKLMWSPRQHFMQGATFCVAACCRPQHTNVCSFINRISTVSTLTLDNQWKISIIYTSIVKGLVCCSFKKIKKFKPSFHHWQLQVVFLLKSITGLPYLVNHWFADIVFSVFQHVSRTTDVDSQQFKKFLTKLQWLLFCKYFCCHTEIVKNSWKRNDKFALR